MEIQFENYYLYRLKNFGHFMAIAFAAKTPIYDLLLDLHAINVLRCEFKFAGCQCVQVCWRAKHLQIHTVQFVIHRK